jgi:hypothetical protein
VYSLVELFRRNLLFGGFVRRDVLGRFCFTMCNSLFGSGCAVGLEVIENYASSGSALVEAHFPLSLKSVDYDAFSHCDNLDTLNFSGTSVETLGSNLVWGSQNLLWILLPPTLRVLGPYCFERAFALRRLDLPASVEVVGISAFNRCQALTDVTFGHTALRELPEYAFDWCTALKNIALPDHLQTLGRFCFTMCNSLQQISLPDPILRLEHVFQGCTALFYVKLPASLQWIGEACFQDCRPLTRITWPAGLQSIGAGAFRGCNQLETVSLPGIVNVDEGAFAGCSAMLSLSFGEGLVRIEPRAFQGCGKLRELSLPSTLRVIGDEAFQGCVGIRHLTLFGNITTWGANVFQADAAVGTLEVRGRWDPGYCAVLGRIAETAERIIIDGDTFCDVWAFTPGRKPKIAIGPIIGTVVVALAAAAAVALVVRSFLCAGGGAAAETLASLNSQPLA